MSNPWSDLCQNPFRRGPNTLVIKTTEPTPPQFGPVKSGGPTITHPPDKLAFQELL